MRCLMIVLSAALALAACEREKQANVAAAPAAPIAVSASDELPDLASTPAGIAFWTHPNVAFNSLMILAGPDGLASYNIEDGTPVSTAPGRALQGAAVSYFGSGAAAAGLVASYSAEDNAVVFFGVDNVSRIFTPLEATAPLRGAVRGICLGRALGAAAPSLFAVQKGAIAVFHLEATTTGVSVAPAATIDAPDNLVDCAVDLDGTLLTLSKKGEVFRVAGENSFAAPFAAAPVANAAGLALTAMHAPIDDNGDAALEETRDAAPQETSPPPGGQLAILDAESAILHILDLASGAHLGAVMIGATDEIEATAPAAAAPVMAATGANLGGLYRNGLIALGVGGAAPAVKLIPMNGVYNALAITPGDAVNPRGQAPVAVEEDFQITTGFQPD